MKNTMLMIVLALAVIATTGLAFAQGAPQDKPARAKQMYRTKGRVLRAKSAVQQKRQILLSKEQTAKVRHMMKLMALRIRQPYDQYTYQPDRYITGRGVEYPRATMYPKCEMLCRMGQQTCPAMQDGGNRGKQGFTGKQMMRHSPLRDKMRQHAVQRGQ